MPSRLYQYDSGNLSRVALTEDNLVKASDAASDAAWETMVDPSAAATERDASAANVFGISSAGASRVELLQVLHEAWLMLAVRCRADDRPGDAEDAPEAPVRRVRHAGRAAAGPAEEPFCCTGTGVWPG